MIRTKIIMIIIANLKKQLIDILIIFSMSDWILTWLGDVTPTTMMQSVEQEVQTNYSVDDNYKSN